MKNLYVASKSKHGPMWKEWRKAGYPIISTWIDESEKGQTTDWLDLWMRCVKEASTAYATICFAMPGEVLKGALVEVGATLANNRTVYYIGPNDIGTWLKHPRIVRCDCIQDAFNCALDI